MLGTSSLVGTTGDGGSSTHDGGSGGGGGGSGGSEAAEANTNAAMMQGDDDKAMSRSGELFESDRSTGGNRWPRQETLALLKIRSDMDVVFRDSSLKGPLWEEVSRKMGELGYHRSAKKCKEKFENVYKYHKRTKDGRVGKSDGKTYRFFDQLEALEQHHMAMAQAQAHHQPPLPQQQQQAPSTQVPPRVVQSQAPAQAAVPVTMVIPAGTNPASVTVPSSPHPISVVHTTCISSQPQQVSVNPANQVQSHLQPSQSHQPQVMQQQHHHHPQHPHPQQQHQTMGVPTHGSIQMENPSSPSATQSSSSSTSSDEELLGRSRKRKRKWKDFFEKLMKEVIDKQEELQKRFLEAVEKREHDRVAREETWKMQEMNRLNREHEILVQERSMAAAKDAALITFLQKLSDQQQIPLPLPAQVQAQTQGQGQARASAPVVASVTTTTQTQTTPVQAQAQAQPQQVLQQSQSQHHQPQPQQHINATEIPVSLPPSTQPHSQPRTQSPQQPPPPLQQALVVANTNNGDNGDYPKSNNGDNLQASSSRWPKAEVQALINLRTSLDQKYQENGPKGPLWEEISSAMRKLGYNRNAKRCKEKWENINKYFKKVKESNKKRPEDSKTCPYFHQLDALYRERNKMEISAPSSYNTNTAANTATITAYGGQQQRTKQEGGSMGPIMVQPEQQWPHQEDQAMEDQGSENQGSENQDDSEEDDVDDDDEDDQGSGGYEIVANNNNSNNNNVNAGSMTTTTAATRTATTE